MKSTVIQILQSTTIIITVNDWHQSCRYLTVKVIFFLKSVDWAGFGPKGPYPHADFDRISARVRWSGRQIGDLDRYLIWSIRFHIKWMKIVCSMFRLVVEFTYCQFHVM